MVFPLTTASGQNPLMNLLSTLSSPLPRVKFLLNIDNNRDEKSTSSLQAQDLWSRKNISGTELS